MLAIKGLIIVAWYRIKTILMNGNDRIWNNLASKQTLKHLLLSVSFFPFWTLVLVWWFWTNYLLLYSSLFTSYWTILTCEIFETILIRRAQIKMWSLCNFKNVVRVKFPIWIFFRLSGMFATPFCAPQKSNNRNISAFLRSV